MINDIIQLNQTFLKDIEEKNINLNNKEKE